MPCPLFEPTAVSISPKHPGARVPLIDEYDGCCHAGGEPFAVPENMRYGCCNHGYARGVCPHFPPADKRSCTRFDLRGEQGGELELLLIDERDHAPAAWKTVRYFADRGTLSPELADACEGAQARAFGDSYLRHCKG